MTADTKDGIITLTGHVRTWAEHDAVLVAALMARGVIDVRDDPPGHRLTAASGTRCSCPGAGAGLLPPGTGPGKAPPRPLSGLCDECVVLIW